MFVCVFPGSITSLASSGVLDLVYQAANISGANMTLPFRIQFLNDGEGLWYDFPFIDQLEIASRICSIIAFKKVSDSSQFPVLGCLSVFEICLVDSVADLWMWDVAFNCPSPAATVRRNVRIVGVGESFTGRNISFASGVVLC
jgi:hypothetical protein